MKRSSLALVAATLVASLGAPAAAQSPAPSPLVDVAGLEALCEANAPTEPERDLCLQVVHIILVPGSGPAPSPAPSGYGSDLPGIGVAQHGSDKDVTLVAVEWNAKGPLAGPAKGSRFVAIRVLYQAAVDGASYNPYDWSVVDLDGFQYDQAFGSKEPALGSSDDLPAGRKAQGWVTFEVPKRVHQLEVVATIADGYLRWLVTEPG